MGRRELSIGERTLTVYDDGEDAGPVILVHHGTPGAGGPLASWVEDVSERGARLITCDRPGYSESTPAPGRSIADAAAGSAALLDALGIERCVC
jgi:pimeloyl-ACP methyl ester carboxylesterase